MMISPVNLRRPGILAALILTAAACGNTGSTSRPAPASTSKLTGALTVFAAASLNGAFTDAEKSLESSGQGFKGSYSFAGSQQLVAGIQNGAPADVIATADTKTMQKLVAAGLVESVHTFARNTLEIAVAKGNPKGIASLAGLAKPGISVVLADPSVPAGNFAQQALQKAGVMVNPKSRELDVTSTLEKVGSGDADAAIVYSTDVTSAKDTVSGVVIPDSQNVVAVYPIAVVKGTGHHAAAAAFVQEAVDGSVQAALRKRGFLAP